MPTSQLVWYNAQGCITVFSPGSPGQVIAAGLDGTPFWSNPGVVAGVSFDCDTGLLTFALASGGSAVVDLNCVVGASFFLEADFTHVILPSSGGALTQFTDRTTGSCQPISWLWEYSLNGGLTWFTFSNERDPTYQFTEAAPSVHSIRLTVACGDGTTSVKTKFDLISVPADITITPNFTFTPGSGPPTLAVDFTDSTSSVGCTPSSWIWEYSSDHGVVWTQFSTSESPSRNFTTDGIYSIRMTAVCTGGRSESITKIDIINVATPAGCTGTELCWEDFYTGATKINWAQTTTWSAGNANFNDGATRQSVFRDGSTVSLNNIASLGINGTIQGGGTATNNCGLNGDGEIVLNQQNGTALTRVVTMTFAVPVDLLLFHDRLEFSKAISVTADQNLKIAVTADGSKTAATNLTGSGTTTVSADSPVGDGTDRFIMVEMKGITTFTATYTAPTGSAVVGSDLEVYIKLSGVDSHFWHSCDVSGDITLYEIFP